MKNLMIIGLLLMTLYTSNSVVAMGAPENAHHRILLVGIVVNVHANGILQKRVAELEERTLFLSRLLQVAGHQLSAADDHVRWLTQEVDARDRRIGDQNLIIGTHEKTICDLNSQLSDARGLISTKDSALQAAKKEVLEAQIDAGAWEQATHAVGSVVGLAGVAVPLSVFGDSKVSRYRKAAWATASAISFGYTVCCAYRCAKATKQLTALRRQQQDLLAAREPEPNE